MHLTVKLVIFGLFAILATGFAEDNVVVEDPEENAIDDGADDQNYAAQNDFSSWYSIFPGTKWCGAGDKAKDYNDLGMHSDTDRCCRAHDLCDDLLNAGETRNNLTNDSPITKLSCKCDHDFYDCLEHVDSFISNKIGNVYFNVLRNKCYELDHPLTKKCKKYRTFLKLTCKEYHRNTSAPKVYQWKNAKFYKKLPIPGPFDIELPF